MYQQNSNTPDHETTFIGLVVKPCDGVFNLYDMSEIFKDIPGYEGIYQVSNLGRVKSLSRVAITGHGAKKPINERILSASIWQGYRTVTLYNIKQKQKNVSVLMAMAFLDHTPNGNKIVVDHINNIKTDDRIENLQLITQRENCSKDKSGVSEYTGVSWNKINEKWLSQIQINGKQKNLGCYNSEYEASQAYRNELAKL